MNILVTGANGQLGRHLQLCCNKTEHNVVFTDVDELDITSADAVREFTCRQHIDTIVNCAAYTNVDQAESDAAAADLVNNVAVGHLATAMSEVCGLLVHISTDYVFGGNCGNTPRTEAEPVNPTGVYGLTKLRGEQAIAASGCKHIIIRTSWLYSEYGKNFMRTMLSLTASRDSVSVVADQVGTPTYAGDLATTIWTILANPKIENSQGLYHYSNEGVCSWYDFAYFIATHAGNTACKVNPCHSSEFPSKVVRPSFSVLDKTKIKNTFNITIPHWTTSAQRCLDNLLNNRQ
ncbi:MAG: dTDP-4-dehydrorhamnose reductase [Bacteroidales bacterium]|nr:dTDP-4-dehydrorhamnose reductase [Bacteroidales bacterium]